MNTYSFRKDLISVQEELLRFAYKLTADKEEANDLLQETSLKALDNEDKYMPDTNFNVRLSRKTPKLLRCRSVFVSTKSVRI